jgi:protein O-mannosyl-transferase
VNQRVSRKAKHPKSRRPEVKEEPVKFSPAGKYILPGILCVCFAAFFPSLFNEFVNWDDYAYIVENPLIRDLSWRNIKHIFDPKTFVVGNYHPLTVLSYALEYKVAELKPFLYHLDNILLHLLNVSLVFLIVRKLSPDNFAVAGITAFLFALHPMRVESVTWAAERKDVLYTLFFMLASLKYLHYTATRKAGDYILSLLFFLLSILSKGQAVVLPLTLLLFDYLLKRGLDRKVVLEKLPFFALSLLFGLLAMAAQHTSLTEQRLEQHSVLERILFASYGTVRYLYNLFVPLNLACFYKYPQKVNGMYPFIYYLSPFLAGTAAWLVYRFRKERYLVFGSLYFLFTISIVLQLLPVGDAIVADRYTYIPYFGLFFIAAHLIHKFLPRLKANAAVRTGLTLYLLSFCFLTFGRTRDWKDNETLWTDVIEKYPQTAIAYNNRGVARMNRELLDEALADLNLAIRYKPTYAEAYNNRATVYGRKKMPEQEIADYTRAIELNPGYTIAYFNRGLAYVSAGRSDLALRDYEKVEQFTPFDPKLHYSKAIAYKNLGNDSLAIAGYTKAIELNPRYAEAYTNRGNICFRQKKYEQAISDYNTALSVDPESGNAYFNRSAAYFEKKEYRQALNDAEQALAKGYNVDPKYLEYIKMHLNAK